MRRPALSSSVTAVGRPTVTRGAALSGCFPPTALYAWRDVGFDGAGAGHPGDGAVGQLASQIEHLRGQRGHQDGAGRTLQGGQLQVDVEEFSLGTVTAPSSSRGRMTDRYSRVCKRRAVVGDAEALLHAGAVGRADAEDEPSVGGRGGGEGLLGQGRRVTGVGRNYADAQLDAAGLHPGQGQGGQGVIAPGGDVGNPEAVEAVVLGLLDAGQQAVEGHQVGDGRANENTDAHGSPPVKGACILIRVYVGNPVILMRKQDFRPHPETGYAPARGREFLIVGRVSGTG